MGKLGEIREVKTADLKPYKKNAKKHSEQQVEKICDSIKEFGFLSPCLIDREMNVIAGHGRILAAKKMGRETVPCVFVEGLTEEQRKAYILADNKLTEMGEWDMDLVNMELQELKDMSFDVTLTGFDDTHFWQDAGSETNQDYEEFVEKYKPKLTTDDCYTPEIVYEAVKRWCIERYNLGGRKIVRPFYPGGDYERFDYPPDCVVLDNPPFSILSEICRFYENRKIDYFLFGPTLTLFSTNGGKSNYLPINGNVTYENGANISTSFITNMGEYKVEVNRDLFLAMKKANEENTQKQRNEIPNYEYPDEVVTASKMQCIANEHFSFTLLENECHYVRALDMQKEYGKALFGAGFLISEEAAKRKRHIAEELERLEAEEAKKTGKIIGKKTWELSEREKKIIEGLGVE